MKGRNTRRCSCGRAGARQQRRRRAARSPARTSSAPLPWRSARRRLWADTAARAEPWHCLGRRRTAEDQSRRDGLRLRRQVPAPKNQSPPRPRLTDDGAGAAPDRFRSAQSRRGYCPDTITFHARAPGSRKRRYRNSASATNAIAAGLGGMPVTRSAARLPPPRRRPAGLGGASQVASTTATSPHAACPSARDRYGSDGRAPGSKAPIVPPAPPIAPIIPPAPPIGGMAGLAAGAGSLGVLQPGRQVLRVRSGRSRRARWRARRHRRFASAFGGRRQEGTAAPAS